MSAVSQGAWSLDSEQYLRAWGLDSEQISGPGLVSRLVSEQISGLGVSQRADLRAWRQSVSRSQGLVGQRGVTKANEERRVASAMKSTKRFSKTRQNLKPVSGGWIKTGLEYFCLTYDRNIQTGATKCAQW